MIAKNVFVVIDTLNQVCRHRRKENLLLHWHDVTSRVAASFSKTERFEYISSVHFSGAQPETFQGRGRFVELGDFDKLKSKTQEKKAPQKKNLELFLRDPLKTTFRMEDSTPKDGHN